MIKLRKLSAFGEILLLCTFGFLWWGSKGRGGNFCGNRIDWLLCPIWALLSFFFFFFFWPHATTLFSTHVGHLSKQFVHILWWSVSSSWNAQSFGNNGTLWIVYFIAMAGYSELCPPSIWIICTALKSMIPPNLLSLLQMSPSHINLFNSHWLKQV